MILLQTLRYVLRSSVHFKSTFETSLFIINEEVSKILRIWTELRSKFLYLRTKEAKIKCFYKRTKITLIDLDLRGAYLHVKPNANFRQFFKIFLIIKNVLFLYIREFIKFIWKCFVISVTYHPCNYSRYRVFKAETVILWKSYTDYSKQH